MVVGVHFVHSNILLGPQRVVKTNYKENMSTTDLVENIHKKRIKTDWYLDYHHYYSANLCIPEMKNNTLLKI